MEKYGKIYMEPKIHMEPKLYGKNYMEPKIAAAILRKKNKA